MVQKNIIFWFVNIQLKRIQNPTQQEFAHNHDLIDFEVEKIHVIRNS